MPPRLKIQRARALRADPTHFETLLWAELRAHRMAGWKWRRQAPIGPFIVDFLCLKARLAVELDGDQHAANREYDQRRAEWLTREGIRVIRFWNHEVVENLEGVCETILKELGGPGPGRARS